MRSSHARQKRGAPIIISVAVIIALVTGGLYWRHTNQKPEASPSLDPNTASHLSQGLKSIEKQDKLFATVKDVKLVVDTAAAEKVYTIIRPLEQLSAEDQAKSTQTLERGTATTLEAFGLAKKSGEGEEAHSLYNSGYFVYRLEGAIVRSSTEAVVKSKAGAEIKNYNQDSNDPNSPYTYANGPVKKIGDITIRTTNDETIKLPVSKYEQTIKVKANAETQKKIVRVLAATKLGKRLLLVNMAVDDATQFGKETQNLQAMADYIKLELGR